MSTDLPAKYKGTVFRVAIPSPLRTLFDYLPPLKENQQTVLATTTAPTAIAPAKAQAGMRVKVPFGNRKLVGIIVKIATESTLPRSKLKPVIEVLDKQTLFSNSLYKLLLWAADYYQHPLGEVFSTAIPARLRQGRQIRLEEKFWVENKGAASAAIQSLDRARKQKALFEFISRSTGRSSKECKEADFNSQNLAELEKKGLIFCQSRQQAVEPFFKPLPKPLASNSASPVKLNQQQKKAVMAIGKEAHGFCCFLLDGVTGSGKTEVYMRAMEEPLSQGKQCLLLVPEIGLTPQTVSRFTQRFPCPVVSLHSGLSESERLAAWSSARDGSAGIIIGTRSAIFTPMAAPGLIIIDEEHDASFKQQEGFRYSARDLAVMRAREEKIPAILGSATPSLESLHNAHNKKFQHLKLDQPAAAAKPATMDVVDISQQQLSEGFSETLLLKIQKHIKEGNQVLVFINRRGFAPFLNCQHCGWISECEHCLTQFTVHANPPSIRCHHCGTARALPRHCPDCKSSGLNTLGIGTQRVEAFLKRQYPDTPTIRIDRDSTRGKSSLSKLLDQVHQGKPCILLGTQMLAKGHHFPNITLVAILDADSGLFSADFRGQEQMAQTIVQVAGRAGRASRQGEVLIQSRHSAHQTLQSISCAPYEKFAQMQLEERKLTAMPPFSHLCLVRAESSDINEAVKVLTRISSSFDKLVSTQGFPVERLGPLPAPMEKRAGRFRVQLLLKSKNRKALQALMSALCQKIDSMKYSHKLRLSIDIDPQDLI